MNKILSKLIFITALVFSGGAIAKDVRDACDEKFRMKDYVSAATVCRKLAEEGNTGAYSRLSHMYERGWGVTQNKKEAFKWILLYGESNLKEGRSLYTLGYRIGNFYHDGEGVDQNYRLAAKWYRLSSDEGLAEAQVMLGRMHMEGKGVIQDIVYAHMWFNVATSTGSLSSDDWRDLVSLSMTKDQIAEAQRLARECVKKNYKGC